MAEWSDEVSRAITRDQIVPGGSLEKHLRRNLFYIIGTTPDGAECDLKLDAEIRRMRNSPEFADSLPTTVASPPKKSELALDPLDLTPQQFPQPSSSTH